VNKPELLSVWTTLTAAYPRSPEAYGDPEEHETFNLWLTSLANMPADVALEAAGALAEQEGRRVFPSLGEFRAEAGARKRQQAVRSPHGWKPTRHCGRCNGSAWVEVDQQGSSMAVIPCPSCDGTGQGNDLPSRPTPPEEAKEHLARLRKLLAENPVVKRVP